MKNASAKKKQFLDVSTKPAKHEQTINMPIFLNGFFFLLKNRSRSNSNQLPLPSKANSLLPDQVAEKTVKFEFIIKEDIK